ncbi:DNA-3-methyladenine glycosylase family protein [Deinococcus petrolearius]|uniref:DNA-3-methyladenine glycosylase II n=1 Tax=Deinococcus petrolearius TaxID=1751295 RepID=A0ABW1DKS1_9DEIO
MNAMTPLPPLTRHADALAHLSRDPVMAEVVARVGELPVLGAAADPFGTLVRSVAGQQLSVRAAASIHGRLVAALGEVTAGGLRRTSGEDLRALGLSWSKVRTVHALADAALSGEIDFAHLSRQGDEEIVAELSALPGIGRWTAEMFLMFGLARPDVFSFGDLALRQALARRYPGAASAAVPPVWSPYRTLGARYLWAEGALHKAGGVPLP